MIKEIRNINIDISIIILVFVSFFTIIYYKFSFDGFYFSDDFSYSYFAHQIITGSFSISDDIFSHRFGVFIPTSFFYLLFGINDYSTTIWPLICQLSSFFLLYVMFKEAGKMVFVFAVILTGLNFYSIYFSNKLFPDIIVSFFLLLAVTVLFKYREQKNIGGKVLASFLFVSSVVCGFLSKETILYAFPFFLLVFINDLLKSKNFYFWVFSFLFLLIFSSVFLLLYKYFTGDYFYRFTIIQAGHYANDYSYFDKDFSALVPRITYEPLMMMVASEMVIPLVFALPIFFKLRWRYVLNLDDKVNFWNILSILLLLMFWFGSTSLKFYNPISLNARMFIMVVPSIAIVGAMGLNKSVKNNIYNLFYSMVFFFIAISSFFFINPKASVIYISLSVCFVIIYIAKKYYNESVIGRVCAAGLFLIMLIHPVFVIAKPTETDFENEKQIVVNNLNSGAGNNLVVTDPLMKQAYLYYFKFNPPENYTYVSNKDLKTIGRNKFDNIFLLINKKTISGLQGMGHSFPDFFIQPYPLWKLVVKKGDVALYKATSPEDFKRTID